MDQHLLESPNPPALFLGRLTGRRGELLKIMNELPPPPKGYELAGILGDYEGDVYGHVCPKGEWFGPCEWNGMKGGADITSYHWPFAKLIQEEGAQ